MTKRIGLGFALLLLACTAWAAGPGAVRKQMEASTLVTGTIEIGLDGAVEVVHVDKPDRLPEGIAVFVQEQIARWRFEPALVDGRPVRARTKMSARLVAKDLHQGRATVSIRGATFGNAEALPEAQRVTARQMAPPSYPVQAGERGAQGTVYLLLRVQPDGSVGDVATEQVNLKFIASEAQMEQLRTSFARVSVAAAKRWTFNPPSDGEAARQPYWIVRVPVDFAFPGTATRYGQWEAYVPGPRQSVAWASEDPSFSPDALPGAGIYIADQNGPKLLTPLDGG
jgi:hypothetical protein